MPTFGNPVFNWEAPCHEQELIRYNAAFIRGWIGDTGVDKLGQYEWPDNEWDTYDKVIQRLEQLIQPQNNNQINKYVLELSNNRQTTESFTNFWTELMRTD